MPFTPFDVEKQYEIDPKLKRSDVKILTEWSEKQPHLPPVTEHQLVLFLHSCYYRLEPAKIAIDNFFTVRTLCPEIFAFPGVEVIKEQATVASINFLPKKTPEGYCVIVMKLIDTNPERYNQVAQINLLDMTTMFHLHHSGPCKGFLSICDMKGLSFGHVTRFNWVALKKHIYYVQEAIPVRLKGIHYVNVVPFADKLISMVKPFMKKELIDLLHFHTDSMESLYKVVPKEILPKEYGGEGPSLATLHEQTSNDLVENVELFRSLGRQKVEEARRPGKPKNSSEIFGVDGSFKQLEVD